MIAKGNGEIGIRPLLSIVSITWNNLSGLRATVESVQRQRLSPDLTVELIVVDKESDDDTAEYVGGVEGLELEYIREPDNGAYDAMNRGTGRARGEYILYLNAGDVLHDSDSLEYMARFCLSHETAVMAAFGALQVAPGVEPMAHRNVPHNWFLHAFGLRPHCHAATVFRADAVRMFGGYSLDKDFAADYDLILRLGLVAKVPSDLRICIEYDTTGLSARRKSEIPLLLHRIRAVVFDYPKWARSLDRSFVTGVESYRTVRKLLRMIRGRS